MLSLVLLILANGFGIDLIVFLEEILIALFGSNSSISAGISFNSFGVSQVSGLMITKSKMHKPIAPSKYLVEKDRTTAMFEVY